MTLHDDMLFDPRRCRPDEIPATSTEMLCSKERRATTIPTCAYCRKQDETGRGPDTLLTERMLLTASTVTLLGLLSLLIIGSSTCLHVLHHLKINPWALFCGSSLPPSSSGWSYLTRSPLANQHGQLPLAGKPQASPLLGSA